jgi:hypothetical protein
LRHFAADASARRCRRAALRHAVTLLMPRRCWQAAYCHAMTQVYAGFMPLPYAPPPFFDIFFFDFHFR